MRKACFCFILFLQIHARCEAMADMSFVNLNRYELSGLLSFDSYANNYQVSNQLEFGANWIGFMNIALGIDLEFRNFSIQSLGTLSTSYRFILGRHEIRPGLCAGMKVLHVGSYSDNTPAAGVQGTYAYNVSRNISLRAQQKLCWFFEEHTVFGSRLLLGIGYSFKGLFQ